MLKYRMHFLSKSWPWHVEMRYFADDTPNGHWSPVMSCECTFFDGELDVNRQITKQLVCSYGVQSLVTAWKWCNANGWSILWCWWLWWMREISWVRWTLLSRLSRFGVLIHLKWTHEMFIPTYSDQWTIKWLNICHQIRWHAIRMPFIWPWMTWMDIHLRINHPNGHY